MSEYVEIVVFRFAVAVVVVLVLVVVVVTSSYVSSGARFPVRHDRFVEGIFNVDVVVFVDVKVENVVADGDSQVVVH